jgi:hypothetical protein
MTGSRIGPFTSIPAALVQNKDVSLGNQLSFQDGPRGRLFRVWSFGWEPMRQGSPRDFATLHVLVPFRRPLTHPELTPDSRDRGGDYPLRPDGRIAPKPRLDETPSF